MSRSRAAASFMSTMRPVVVDGDEPFAYSVQHRLAGLEHRSDLIGFESVDATADDPSDPCGPDDADHRGDDERGEEPAEAAEEVGAELGLEDADGDLAHDLAVVGENRHLHRHDSPSVPVCVPT